MPTDALQNVRNVYCKAHNVIKAGSVLSDRDHERLSLQAVFWVFFIGTGKKMSGCPHLCPAGSNTHTHTHIKFTHTYRHTNTHRNTDQRELVQSYSCVVKMVIVTHDGDDGDNMTSL